MAIKIIEVGKYDEDDDLFKEKNNLIILNNKGNFPTIFDFTIDKKYLYLAETFNLMGKNIEENYQIESLLFSADDFTVEIWYAFLIEDEAKRAEVLKPLCEKFKFY